MSPDQRMPSERDLALSCNAKRTRLGGWRNSNIVEAGPKPQTGAETRIESNRLEGIEALRGWAASAVLMLHAATMYPLTLPPSTANFLCFLRYGVPLFFVISAFSLTYGYSGRLNRSGAIGSYSIRRFFRIAPLFYAMMLFWGWFACLGCFPFSKMEYFLNLTFTFGLVPGYQNSIVPAGWSIGTEMIFYAIFPLCLIFAQGLARSIWLVGLLVLVGWTANQAFRAAGFAHLLFYWTNVFTNLPYFGIGIIACAVFKRLAEYPEKAVLARLLLATSVAAGVLLATFGSTPCSDFSAEPPALWETLGWGLVFAAVATSQALRPSRLVANPAATALGKISFSLYLIHPLVFHAFPVIPAIERWTVLPAFKLLAVWTFGFAVMIPLAYVAFHLVEVPGQLVGRWLSERERRLPYGRWRKAN